MTDAELDHDLEFYVDDAGEHRWRVRAKNGEIIAASSEGYSSRTAAEDNFRSVEALDDDAVG